MSLLLACPHSQQQLPRLRAPRDPSTSVENFYGAVLAAETRASSVITFNQILASTTRTRVPLASLLIHGPSSKKGTTAFSADPLSRDISSAMKVRAPNATPLAIARLAFRALPLSTPRTAIRLR